MADIVLRDRSGVQIQYPGVERLKLNTVDGGTAEFVDAGSIPVEIENSPITLDFSSGGNQLVEAPEGYVVKSAIIERPAALIPGNIAEGVDIAGIIGTLAAGGGGSGVAIAGGTVVAPSVFNISHGLGVVPDLVLIWPQLDSSSYAAAASSYGYMYIGISDALAAKMSVSAGAFNDVAYSTNKVLYVFKNNSLTTTGLGKFYATADVISAWYADENLTYNWLAIAGLT